MGLLSCTTFVSKSACNYVQEGGSFRIPTFDGKLASETTPKHHAMVLVGKRFDGQTLVLPAAELAVRNAVC
jgi:hypothetical protein